MNFLAAIGYRSMLGCGIRIRITLIFWFRIQMLNIQSSFEKVQLKYLQRCSFLTQFYLFLAGMPLSKPQKPDPVFKCWIRIWIRMERLRIRNPKFDVIFSELFISFIRCN